MNKLQAIVSSAMAVATAFATAAAVNNDVSPTLSPVRSSSLSSGLWIKIHIDEEGIYQLSHERLRELGFSNPKNVHVYGYGAAQLMDHNTDTAPDDLPEVSSIHVGDKLLCYLESTDVFTYSVPENTLSPFIQRKRNTYSSGATYFLSDTSPLAPAGISSISAPALSQPTAEVRTTHQSITYLEEDLTLPAEGGNSFLGLNLIGADPTVYSINITKPASTAASVDYRGGIHSTTSNNYLTLTFSDPSIASSITYNPGQTASKAGTYDAFRVFSKVAAVSLPSTDDATYTFQASFPGNIKRYISFAAIDSWAFRYERQNDLTGDSSRQMIFFDVREDEHFSLSGIEPETMVWNVDNIHRVVSHELNGTIGAFGRTSDAIRLIAFNPIATFPEPHVVKAPVPAQNLHAMQTPDMVIVTTPLFADCAKELAEIHISRQGLDVAVIMQEDIFNEFSSGNNHPMAVRRFLKLLDDRTPGKLKFLLLYGSGTNFNHTRLTNDGSNLITAQNEDLGSGGAGSGPDSYGNYDVTRAFCCDAYFGKLGPLAENTNAFANPFFKIMSQPMTIAVGRLPFESITEAVNYNIKAADYLDNPPTVAAPNRALFMSGYATRKEDMHMADTESMLKLAAEAYGPRLTSIRAAQNMYGTTGTDLYGTVSSDISRINSLITQARQLGVGFMTYFGHGSNKQLGEFWNTETERGISHPGLYPVAFFGTCHFVSFDVQKLNLSAAMLFKSNGGPIVMVGAGRQVYQNRNTAFGQQFTKDLYAAADGTMLGNIYLDSHNAMLLANNKPMMCNTMCYNFFGDPALPLYTASRTISVDAVNGNNAAAATLFPASSNTLSGTINDYNGNVDDSFNGIIKIAVYDHPFIAVNTAPNSSSPTVSTIAEIEMDHEQLTELTGEVRNGRFSVTGFIPNSIRPGESNRITMYAYTSDNKIRAAGSLTGATMTDTPGETGDYPAPAITVFHINSPEYDGSAIHDKSVRIHATISAPAGLRTSSQFGNCLRLTHNGNVTGTPQYMINSTSPGEYTLVMDLENLPNGNHELTLTVTDNLQQQTDANLSFRIETRPESELHIDEESTEEIRFSIVHELESDAEAVVIIENHSGIPVARITSEGNTAVWNLTDNNGSRTVPAGHYAAYVKIHGISGNTSSAKIHISVP